MNASEEEPFIWLLMEREKRDTATYSLQNDSTEAVSNEYDWPSLGLKRQDNMNRQLSKTRIISQTEVFAL